jgi:ribonuclease-3
LLGNDVTRLEGLLNYRFRDPVWLERALTHRSAAHERNSGRATDNEQLEFLGDSILGFCISEWLFKRFPHLNEGELSKIRSQLVSAANLIKIARQLSLGDFLYLGKGEEKTGGRKKRTLLVDAYEALLAAICLDGGLEASRRFIYSCFQKDFDALEAGDFDLNDFKSQLQEKLQSLRLPAAQYVIAGESGPDHKKVFAIDLKVNGKKLATGHGETKKGAEQEAARRALEIDLQTTFPVMEPGADSQDQKEE